MTLRFERTAALRRRLRLPAFALTPLALALMSSVQAQTVQPAAPAASQAGSATLPEISVRGSTGNSTERSGSYTTTAPTSTATKLGLTARETPQSMTIITRELMEEMGLTNLVDVMQMATPGVYVTYNDTERFNFSSRGYNITAFQIDGMLNTFGGNLRANGDTVVYDRLEVVRGAAGLTTGAGDPSATVNQVRKRPTRAFQGNAAVSVGSHDLYRVEGDISGPLIEGGAVRGRVVLAKQKKGSFRDLYEEDRDVLYGILEADLGPDTTAALGYEHQSRIPKGSTWGTVLYWNADGSLANMPRSLNLSTPWASWSTKENTTFGQLEHRFNEKWKLRASLSRTEREIAGKLYFGYGGYPRPDGSGITVAYGSFPLDETMDTVDVNVEGRYALFGREHKVAFGYGESRRAGASRTVTSGAAPGTIPDWRTWTGDIPEFTTTATPLYTGLTILKQTGAYASTQLNVADPLKVVLGVRHSNWRTETRNFNGSTGARTTTTGYVNDDILTPYAGVLYDFNANLTGYVSYTDIFAPQNFRDVNNQPLDPVVGASYEAGLKGEFLDKQLTAGVAVFRSKKDNVAEEDTSVDPTFVLPGGERPYRTTGKGNKVEGVEFDIAGRVTRRWNVGGGYSHVKSRNALGVALNTTVPRNTLRLNTSYKFGGMLEGATLGGGVSWYSKSWSNAQRPNGTLTPTGAPAGFVTTPIVQGRYTLFNLMAGYRINDSLQLSMNVNNLFDKHYYNRVGFYNGVHWGEPRSMTVTLRGTF